MSPGGRGEMVQVGERVHGDPLERLLSLRQYNASGKRAPHKPLLVLLALSALVRTGSSRLVFSDIEDTLAGLIAEFGPPSGTSRSQAAAYPFTRLRSDGVWTLDADVPMDRVVGLTEVSGRLTPDIEAELAADPARLASIARQIVDRQFAPSLAEEVLVAVGLEQVGDPVAPRTAVELIGRRARSAAWRRSVIEDWDGACAFCGYDGASGGVPVGVEAAHVRWFNFGGPDDPDNGMALCSLHHKLFDRGVLGLSTDRTVVVSRSFRAGSPAGRAVYDLDGLRIRARPGVALPAVRHIEWHWGQVFRAPGLRVG